MPEFLAYGFSEWRKSMIYVIGHPLSHAFLLSIFSNHPKVETVDMCFHDCLLVVQHLSATAPALPPYSCEKYCEILPANRWNPELVATIWVFSVDACAVDCTIENVRCNGHSDDPNQWEGQNHSTLQQSVGENLPKYNPTVRMYYPKCGNKSTMPPYCRLYFDGCKFGTPWPEQISSKSCLAHFASHCPNVQFDPLPHGFPMVRCKRWNPHPIWGCSRPWHRHPGVNGAKNAHVPRHPLNANLSENIEQCIWSMLCPNSIAIGKLCWKMRWKILNQFDEANVCESQPNTLMPTSTITTTEKQFVAHRSHENPFRFHTPCFREKNNVEATFVYLGNEIMKSIIWFYTL